MLNHKAIKIIVLIVVLLLMIFAVIMLNQFKNYQKIVLQDIELQKNQLDGKRVEYTGIWNSQFETSVLDNKIWLEYSGKNTEFVPSLAQMPGADSGFYYARVKVLGILKTKEGSYGHLGMESYQIVADKIELLEKLYPPTPGK